MGALTVASLMAQLQGKRVLVLERHFKAGGFTHSFQRQKFHWDVGIHYVGQMNESSSVRQLFDLVTRKGVQWNKMPEPFEKFVYPDFQFALYGNKERYIADLLRLFPTEEKAIRHYFKDLSKAANALFLHSLRQNGTALFQVMGWLGKIVNRFPLNLTTQAYLDSHFQNPQLKALLASQWGTYGLPPAQSSFAVHATIVNHYLDGGYYPVGGAGTIAKSVEKIVEEHGGKFLLNREVTEILIENNRAVGVRVRKVNTKDVIEEYYAPAIISNAGAATTYLKLIPSNYPIPFRESLRRFMQQHPPATNVTLYLGLSSDPRQLGFQGENHWIYEDTDHNKVYGDRANWIHTGKPLQAYLSFPSLKDPKATTHTAEIITWADYDEFVKWREQPWLHRDRDYQTLKQGISQALIDLVDRHYPGFANLVEYCEVSTPITNEHFTAHPQGGIYGIAAVTERFQAENAAWMKAKTPLEGLYLTGADLVGGGIVPATIAGAITIAHIPGGIPLAQTFTTAAKFGKHEVTAQPLLVSNRVH
ncbi:NAD(P)/FAD-dependent oxidoreductase [Planktothrix sp. FACHB-1375]|uniref:NAD(P)/FAD-dependent oxidoreductase n=3 Tax=Oscillatoriophycideae TaxID=1301283 RepID=A0A926ZL12_9CYAN|nr:NAD(P)/FAD-dependent oxidoreductase [Aerosakkonema funiforme FACHB-1375]